MVDKRFVAEMVGIVTASRDVVMFLVVTVLRWLLSIRRRPSAKLCLLVEAEFCTRRFTEHFPWPL
jgi:hypothetical protein